MKAKRLVSLLMALMLVIGIFAVPAMAAQDDDGIELYGPVIPCDNCGASISTSSTETWNEEGHYNIGCALTSIPHHHDITYRCTGYKCASCGAKIYISTVKIVDKCSFKTT